MKHYIYIYDMLASCLTMYQSLQDLVNAKTDFDQKYFCLKIHNFLFLKRRTDFLWWILM